MDKRGAPAVKAGFGDGPGWQVVGGGLSFLTVMLEQTGAWWMLALSCSLCVCVSLSCWAGEKRCDSATMPRSSSATANTGAV